MIWSPSTSSPSASTARQRSASPSWAMPRSAPCSTTAARSGSRWVEPHAVVDVEAVRLGVDHDDLGAGPAVASGPPPTRRRSRSPPRPSARPAAAGWRHQVVDVASGRRRDVAHPADARTGRPASTACRRPPRSASSTSSGSLCPPAAKSLMPLSGIGLCDAEIITPEVGAERSGEVRDGRGRQHADPDHVRAGGGKPGDDGRLEHLAAGPRVAPDHGHGGSGRSAPRRGRPRRRIASSRRVALAPPGHRPCRTTTMRRAPEHREQRRAVRPARSDAVRAEQPSHAVRDQRLSTAEPCGPSSGRTSCARWPGRRG